MAVGENQQSRTAQKVCHQQTRTRFFFAFVSACAALAKASASPVRKTRTVMPPSKPIAQLTADFKQLVHQSINDQLQLFLKSFIFDLGDDWKHVVELSKYNTLSYRRRFQKYLDDLGEGATDLNAMQAADFLQKEGRERTGLQRKEEIRDVDLDGNDRIAYIEYLLLHYKVDPILPTAHDPDCLLQANWRCTQPRS